MANNERVSQLIELFASNLDTTDVFLVTDTSQKESKKLEVGQLLLFIENSGSFSAYHSILSDTSSYVKASNIDGIVTSSLSSSLSISSSFSNFAKSSSHSLNADTASYSTWCVVNSSDADTSSYLNYTGIPNGTASYSLQSQLSNTATTALNLFYNGTPNGTASYAITASNALIASSSVSSNTSSYLFYDGITPNGVASNAVYSTYSDNSLLSLNSINAQTASYFTQRFGPTFISPVTITSSYNIVNWTTYICDTNIIPPGTNVVILQALSTNGTTTAIGTVQIRQNSMSPSYILIGYRSGGGGDACTYGGQGSFPVASSLGTASFQYEFTAVADGATTLQLVGYY